MNEQKYKIFTDNGIDFIAIFKNLRQRIKLIVLITFIITVFAIIYALMLAPLYKSTITINPYQSKSSNPLDNLRGMAASFGVNVPQNQATLDIKDILESRRLKTLILKKMWNTNKYNEPVDLYTYWAINDTTGNAGFSLQYLNPITWLKYLNPMTWFKKISKSKTTEESRTENGTNLKWEDTAIRTLNGRISFKQSYTGLLSVYVLMEEPKLAADLSNFIYKAIVELTFNISSSHVGIYRKFIEKRRADTIVELEKAEEELTKFRERNRTITNSPQLQLELERLMREVQIQTEIYITLQQQFELAKIEEIKETPSIVILDEAVPPLYKDQPKRKIMVIKAFIIGIILGTMLAMVKIFVKNKEWETVYRILKR